ncbi:hypothetical protein TPL01_21960 [Sulfuriferula plumbiphila]|uniref:Resolvase/invertase-type recombinase catalytic domain-containing protein n=1 Tax=Sulfuriferula plumbiphila TaxID=171865 RepID=A0A512L992_9PROT|nr:helix-turn-helix domain-containing protein [Sulfuriferula plumbiphila]BBP03020.1 hypothetical protein SFPGR_04420 [Sulfuriferula plumbiphila]GEP31058.1 hypothetical protein TPL01_21960 [Sulfuriferula plumbiphila]
MFGALAEFERSLIRERTMAGRKAARARGRKGAHPKKLSPKDLRTIKVLLKFGDVTIAQQFGISRSTIYRYAGRPS